MDIEKARAVRSSDMTPTELADSFGVSRQTISQIRSGRTWVETSNPFAGLGARK
jgi:DNA-binding XRE family transcriptional regulator